MSTIAVDFDGVIHAYSRGWQDGSIYDEPMPDAFSALHWLMDQHAVFIHTTRTPRLVADWIITKSAIECVTGPVGEFWDERGKLLVTDRKLPALAYIDDRAVQFRNWDQTLNTLADLGLWRRP